MSGIASSGAAVSHESRAQVDGLLAELDTLARSVASSLAELTQITKEVKDTAARAIRALQFEDIIGQLTGTVLDRIARLRAVERAIDGALDGRDLAGAIALIVETRRHKQVRNVEQNSMKAGAVEVF